MFIKISNLDDGVHKFSFDEKINEVDLSEPFYDNFQLDATLNKAHNQIILDASLTLNANFDCDRCGTNFNTIIKSTYQQVYLFATAPEEIENEDTNVTYLPHDTDRINLDVDIRDFSYLAVPMKKLCDEDCEGLCYSCGMNLNEGTCNCDEEDTDPRWAPLKELKDKLNTN